MSKEIKDMEFEELLKWANQADWEEVTNEQWKDYEAQCKKLAPKYLFDKDIVELMNFYREYSGDGIDPWFTAWDKAVCESYPFSSIHESIQAIERSLSVLLKEHDKEPAKITIGQLNRLKGGL